MAGKFRLKSPASVLHINARKEGPDDDKVLAVDVKLQAEQEFDALDFFEPALRDFLYLPGGAVRNILMGPVTFSNELENYRLEIAGSTHFGVKVKRFSIEPKDSYRFVLTFQISFKPSGDEVAQIAEYLQDMLDVVLEPESEELDLGDGGIVGTFNSMAESVAADGGSFTLSNGSGDVFMGAGNEHDPVYAEAVSAVIKSGRPSISLVQRTLSLGYNRAARLIEQMEKDGLVTPMDSSGSRLITDFGRSQAA